MKTLGPFLLFLTALHSFLFFPLMPLMAQSPKMIDDLGPKPKIVSQGFKQSIMRGDPLTIKVRVTDRGAIEKVTLFYRRTGELEYLPLDMASQGGGVYGLEMPKHALEGTDLQYYIQAIGASPFPGLLGFTDMPFKTRIDSNLPNKQIKPWYKKWWGIALITGIVGGGIAVAVGGEGGGGGGSNETTGSASISGQIP